MLNMFDVVKSWSQLEGKNNIQYLYNWVNMLNKNTYVSITKNKLSDSKNWVYDAKNGTIHNDTNSFFQIVGLQRIDKGRVLQEQPILVQDEIGYLGIICKKINGILHFLMQAKVEPGNINNVQISPTIQATKSNFTQKHGGRKPNYLEYFIDVDKYEVMVDQIQSEQSSRFLGKRNRNIIAYVSEDCEIQTHKNFEWMTLGQIKALMKKENLVNMDTRTVLSCIPFSMYSYSNEELNNIEKLFNDKALFKSIFIKPVENMLPQIYRYFNNYKMFDDTISKLVPLSELKSWDITDENIKCKDSYHFFVTFCDISIEGREVKQWSQPLFEAVGMASFGLFTTVHNGVRKFLVKGLSEVGCFDKMELAPTIQLEAGYKEEALNDVDRLFLLKYEKKQGILYDTILSEEGGRFYHEQNYNRIIEIDYIDIAKLPVGYFWVDYYTLNLLNQFNNSLNIQLRNLLSLLEV